MLRINCFEICKTSQNFAEPFLSPKIFKKLKNEPNQMPDTNDMKISENQSLRRVLSFFAFVLLVSRPNFRKLRNIEIPYFCSHVEKTKYTFTIICLLLQNRYCFLYKIFKYEILILHIFSSGIRQLLDLSKEYIKNKPFSWNLL